MPEEQHNILAHHVEEMNKQEGFLVAMRTAAPHECGAVNLLFFQYLIQRTAARTLPVSHVAHVIHRPAGAFAHH